MIGGGIAVLVGGVLLGASMCVEPEPPAPPEPAWSPPTTIENVVPVDARATGGASLELRFTNISALHRSFFSDGELVAALSEGLGGCFTGVVPVVVTYDAAELKGHVVLDVSREQLACVPTTTDAGIDVSALVPASRALATYRNGIAAVKDIRVYSFDAGLFVRDGVGWSSLWIYGQEPADGTTFHPCVGLDGLERCTPAQPHEGVLSYDLGEGWVTRRLATSLTPGAPLGVATEDAEAPASE